MASSNIKLFDENKSNMISDEAYNVNSQRISGVQSGIASSQLHNKSMYQLSLVSYAIAQMMVANGYDANDSSSVSTFVSNLSNSVLQKIIDKATTSQAQSGTDNTKWMTPKTVKDAINELAAKAQNVLSDNTKILLGLTTAATPDDAFLALLVGAGNYGYSVTVKQPDGNPAAGVTVSGITPLPGRNLVTDSNGKTFGISTSSSVTLSATSNWIDLTGASKTVNSTGTITQVELGYNTKSGAINIQSSGTYYHSSAVRSIDFSVAGGGGGGGSASMYDYSGSYRNWNGGGGGGGGYVNSVYGISPSPDRSFSVIIGGGGSGGANISSSVSGVTSGNPGGSGGTSSVTVNGNSVVSASGGSGGSAYASSASSGASGGSGNGKGGNGSSSSSSVPGTAYGSSGTGRIFDDSSLPEVGGGGGGGVGGQASSYGVVVQGASGGSPNGGMGSGHGSGPYDGSSPGGGGGGGGYSRTTPTGLQRGRSGGSGAAYVKFNY